MKTAKLIAIDRDPKSTVVFALAETSNGEYISGVGFTFEDGKYDAMWDLTQHLTKRGIELQA